MRNVKFSRRTLLAGLGVGGAFCSGLTSTIYAQTAPRITRVAMFGYANGSHPDSAPTGSGKDFVLKPHMAPLEAVRNDVLIFRNMTLQRGSGNSHKATSYSIFGLGASTSIDQHFAAHFKGTTSLPSLEIAIGRTEGGGGVIPGLSQVDGNFIPGVRTPVAAYQRIAERIVGPAPVTPDPLPTTPSAAELALRRRKSVLDFVKDDVLIFQGRLGPEERAKLDFYLESLRTLERDIGGMIPDGVGAGCKQSDAVMLSTETSVNDMPTHNRLYLDTIALAFACNITRVASAMWGGGQSNEAFKLKGKTQGAAVDVDIDVSDWHSTSHLDPNGAGGRQMIDIQAFMAGEFAYFVQKLKSYSDGEFNLLDNTAAVLSTQNGTSTQVAFAAMDHPKQNSPFVVAGSCGGAWTPGRVIDCDGRNHNDVYLSIARAVGMDVTSVGDPAWCQGPMIS